MFVKKIIVNGVIESMENRLFSLQTSCELLGWLSQVLGMRNEAMRCRLITEVQGSSGFENVAETSGFYGAGFHSGSETSTEPVVFSHARDFISASSCPETPGSQVENDHVLVGFCCVILKHLLERLGNLNGALSLHLESLSLAESSAKYAPNNEKVQWELSFGYQHVADCYLRLEKNEEARDYASQCIEIRQSLANRDHENSQLHAKLLHNLKTLALACERQQDLEAALQAYRQIIQVSKEFKSHTGKDRFQKASRSAYANSEQLLMGIPKQVSP